MVHIFIRTCHLLFPGDIERVKRKLPEWDEAVSRHLLATEPLRIVSFIDATNDSECKPKGAWAYQRADRDGHKKEFAKVWSSLVSPDGIMWQVRTPHTTSW
jgi:hypothetical protein